MNHVALINTQDNYVHYRRTFLGEGGLPHLLPHRIAYERCNDHGLQDIFGYVDYQPDLSIPRPPTQSEGYGPRQKSVCLRWVGNLWEYITQASCLGSA